VSVHQTLTVRPKQTVAYTDSLPSQHALMGDRCQRSNSSPASTFLCPCVDDLFVLTCVCLQHAHIKRDVIDTSSSIVAKDPNTKVSESESSIPQTIDEPDYIADVFDEEIEGVA
jgi:hypothetical protein